MGAGVVLGLSLWSGGRGVVGRRRGGREGGGANWGNCIGQGVLCGATPPTSTGSMVSPNAELDRHVNCLHTRFGSKSFFFFVHFPVSPVKQPTDLVRRAICIFKIGARGDELGDCSNFAKNFNRARPLLGDGYRWGRPRGKHIKHLTDYDDGGGTRIKPHFFLSIRLCSIS